MINEILKMMKKSRLNFSFNQTVFKNIVGIYFCHEIFKVFKKLQIYDPVISRYYKCCKSLVKRAFFLFTAKSNKICIKLHAFFKHFKF